MVALNPRQLGPETAAGVSNSALVVDPTAATEATDLVVDGAAPTRSVEAPPLVADSSSTPVVTDTTQTLTSSPSPSQESVAPVSASGKSISLSTVIGSCVGAFVGAALLIAIGFYFYRRYSASLKQKSRRRPLPRSAFTDNNNTRGGPSEARNSKTWNRLDSGEFEDKWENKDTTGARPPHLLTVPPLEKMDMFKTTPSTSSHHAGSDEHGSAFEMQQQPRNHPYGQLDNSSGVPEARDLLGREPIDSGPPISWVSSSPSQTSFLSAAHHLESGAMSPTLAMAIPTPPATRSSQPHRWESAEVVNIPEAQSAEYVDDDDAAGSRTSLHNPFFSGGANDRLPPRRKSTAARSRSNSNATITQQSIPTIVTPSLPSKFVERESMVDPFNDPLPPAPAFRSHHTTTSSASSAASNERAIRQLVAAAGMDLNEDEVQRRLKAVSLQPSVISDSGDSMYTDADPDLAEEALRSFPKPPSSSSHSRI